MLDKTTGPKERRAAGAALGLPWVSLGIYLSKGRPPPPNT